MPKVLVDVDAADEFTTPVTVPDGDDDMDDAANVVEALAQRLANRTRHLTNRTGKLAGNNQWTGDNTFENVVRINDTAIFNSFDSYTPGVHVERHGGSYQAIVSGQSGAADADRVYMYSGASPATQGGLLFVVNARRQAGGWVRNVEGRDSTALIVNDGSVRVVTRGSGESQPWASWAEGTLSDLNSEMLAEAFRASRMLATGNTFLNYSNGFRYITPVQRISPIPLGLCWGATLVHADGHVGRDIALPNQYVYVWFPIPVPPFCTFSTVQVRFHQLQSSPPTPDQFQLYRRTQADGWVAQGTAETHGSFGLTTATLHPGDAQVVLDGDEWAYRWRVVSTDPVAADNRIVGLSVNWTDYGPNNRVG